MIEDENSGAGIVPGAGISKVLMWALKAVICVSIFSMALLIFIDVELRYFFNSPIQAVFEINGMILGLVTFAALPLVTMDRSHITVDLFDHLFRGRIRKVQQFTVLLFTAVMIGFISVRLYATAIAEAEADYVSVDLGLSRTPLLLTMSALGMITVLIVLVMAWQLAAGRLAVKPPTAMGGVDENAP